MIKKTVAWIFALSLFAGAATAMTEKLKVSEWAGLTEQRKIYFTLGSIEEFQEKGILFRHSMDDYIHWMDEAAAANVAETNMDDIFSGLVKVHEASPPKINQEP